MIEGLALKGQVDIPEVIGNQPPVSTMGGNLEVPHTHSQGGTPTLLRQRCHLHLHIPLQVEGVSQVLVKRDLGSQRQQGETWLGIGQVDGLGNGAQTPPVNAEIPEGAHEVRQVQDHFPNQPARLTAGQACPVSLFIVRRQYLHRLPGHILQIIQDAVSLFPPKIRLPHYPPGGLSRAWQEASRRWIGDSQEGDELRLPGAFAVMSHHRIRRRDRDTLTLEIQVEPDFRLLSQNRPFQPVDRPQPSPVALIHQPIGEDRDHLLDRGDPQYRIGEDNLHNLTPQRQEQAAPHQDDGRRSQNWVLISMLALVNGARPASRRENRVSVSSRLRER